MINISLKTIPYLISENTHTITTPIQTTQHPQQISQTQIDTLIEENIHSKTKNKHKSYDSVSSKKNNKHNENIINSGNHPKITSTTSVAIVEEFPEQVTTITENVEGKSVTKTIRKRILRKKMGRNEQITKIITTQEDNMEPTTTVDVTENVLGGSLEIIKPSNEYMLELPEEITIILKETEDGKQAKKTIRKRVLKKKKGSKEEVTEIITTEGDNMDPKICVFVTELRIDEEAPLVKELPEQISTTITEDKYGNVITKTWRKRILKKIKGPNEEIIEITTKEETGIEPKTFVVVTEQLIDKFSPTIEELPEQIMITVLENEKGKKITRTIRKRILRKKMGSKEQITEIVTTHEDEIEPFTTVIVTEQLVNESVDEIIPLAITIIEELPEEITTRIKETNDGKPMTKTIKKRVLKKKKGQKEEIIKITTTEGDHMEPKTCVDVSETTIDEGAPIVEELPEQIMTTITEDKYGKTATKTIRKRTIKKKIGPKEEITEITTTEQSNMEPKTYVMVMTTSINDPSPNDKVPEQITNIVNKDTNIKDSVEKHNGKNKKPSKGDIDKKFSNDKTKQLKSFAEISEVSIEEAAAMVDELPEQLSTIVTENRDGKTVTKTVHKRTLRKRQGKNEQITEIITTHEDNMEPSNVVIVTENILNESEEANEPMMTVAMEELPEEITTIIYEPDGGKQTSKTIQKCILKNKNGDKDEVTEIITTYEDNMEPKICISVNELRNEEFAPIIQESPEQITTTITEDKYGKKTTKTLRKHNIKNKKEPWEKITHKHTIEEPTMEPEAFIMLMAQTINELPTIDNKLTQGTFAEESEKAIEELSIFVEELPEHINTAVVINDEGKAVTKTVRKRTIRKIQGPNEQITEITTIHEDNNEPTTTVEITENILNDPKVAIDPTLTIVLEELPEDITTMVKETENGTHKTKTIRKRVLKKKKGDKEEIIEIITTEEDNMEPKISVFLTEFKNEDIDPLVEELPEQITTTITVNKNGNTTKKILRKRPLRKKIGLKEEITEIITKEETDMELETFVMETIKSVDELEAIVEELPEQISTTVTENFDGKTITKTQHKRLLRKREGHSEQITEIMTTHEDGVEPFTTVNVTEQRVVDSENLIKPLAVIMEELPEEITTIIKENDEGKQTYKTIQKRTLKKKKGDKEEITEIITTDGDGMAPEIAVFVKVITIDESVPMIVELPEQSRTTITEDKYGRTTTKTLRKRTIKKKIGSKEEITEITTIEESDMEPQTFVFVKTKSITESNIRGKNIPKIYTNTIIKDKNSKSPTKSVEKKEKRVPEDKFVEILSSNKTSRQQISFDEETDKYIEDLSAIVEELPEQIYTSLTENNEGKTITKTIRKRLLRKKQGRNEQITEIITTHVENQEPTSVVVVTENILDESVEEVKPTLAVFIEELPEEITTIVKKNHDGRQTSKTIKKRVLKKKRGPKEEVTEIITTEEDDIEPKVCVFITESTIVESTPILEELPEQITTTITTDKNGKTTTKNVRKRILKKKMGPREEITEIITKEESELEPEIHVRVIMKLDDELAAIVEELPEKIYTTETENGKGKTVTKTIQKRVFRERRGGNEKITEITTTYEENMEPTIAVVVQENVFDASLEAIEPPLTAVIEELPEQTTTIINETNDGKQITKTIRKRILIKKTGTKEEVTEIITTEGDNIASEITVFVKDIVPDESVPTIKELPVQVKTIITEDKYGMTTTKKLKRRIIIKKRGLMEEITEIITKEETNMEPEIFVVVKIKSLDEPHATVEDLPEKFKTTVKTYNSTNPVSKGIRKRLPKKKKGHQEKVTQITATDEDDMEPEIVITELKNYERASIFKKNTKKINNAIITDDDSSIEPKTIEMVTGNLFALSAYGDKANNIITSGEDFTRDNILNDIHSTVTEEHSILSTNFKTQNRNTINSNTLDVNKGIFYYSHIAC